MKLLVATIFVYFIVSIISARTTISHDLEPRRDYTPEVIDNATATLLNYIPVPNTKLTVSTWVTKSYLENNTEAASRSTSVAAELLQYYNDLLKTRVPSNKLDIEFLVAATGSDAENLSRNHLVKRIATKIAKQWFGTVASVQ